MNTETHCKDINIHKKYIKQKLHVAFKDRFKLIMKCSNLIK